MNWPCVRLEKLVVDMQPGFACRPTDEGRGIAQLRTNNVSAAGRLDLSGLKYVAAHDVQLERYAMADGDVLFNNTNSPALVGKTAYFDRTEPFLFSNHMTRIRTDGAVLDARYLARFLHWTWSTGGFSKLVVQWVSQAAINRTQLAAFLVPLPSISEQRRLVELFDQADSLRCRRGCADKKAERILPALFLKMFGDPSKNPKGFEVLSLGNPRAGVLDRGRSRHRPRNDPALLGGPHPLIQTGDVARCDGRIRTFTQTYSDLGLAQSKMWPAGTLCITIAANIAETGVLEFDACFPDSVVGFVPGEATTTEYVQFYLMFLQPVLEKSAPQAAQKNINLEILRGLPLPVPPRERQESFSQCVQQHYEARRRQLVVRERLDALFANMLRHGFSGSLTASWREAHMREVLQEMEQQSRHLAAAEVSS